jgi:hypothetical protein
MHPRIGIGMRGIALASLLALVAQGPASADSLTRRGSCSGQSDWKLVVRQETANTLRVRFDIEGGESGQTWQLFLSDNGHGIYARNKVSGSDGEVRARTITADRPGTDRIAASGVNLSTGESCNGSLAF